MNDDAVNLDLEAVDSLLFCSSAGYGVGNVGYNLVDRFHRAGIDVTYCTNPFNDIPEGVEVVSFLNDQLYNRIHDMVQNTFLYPPTQLVLANIYFWTRALRYVDQHGDEYDAVWLNGPHAIPGSLQRPALDGTLVTLHNSLYSERPEQHKGLYGLYYKIAGGMQRKMVRSPGIGHITAVDDGICDEVVACGVSEDRVSYIGNGVDTMKFRPFDTDYLQAELGIPEDHTVLLSLGRMTAQKEPKRLVRLFDRLSGRMDDVTLVMAGAGELLPEVRSLTRELDTDNICLPGYVAEADKPKLYAASDFYIMSSAYEGQPLTLFEAMASGTPCIVPDLPNLQLVADASCGRLVDYDTDDVVATVEEYISVARAEHGSNARQYAESTLSWQTVCEQYADLLGEIAYE